MAELPEFDWLDVYAEQPERIVRVAKRIVGLSCIPHKDTTQVTLANALGARRFYRLTGVPREPLQKFIMTLVVTSSSPQLPSSEIFSFEGNLMEVGGELSVSDTVVKQAGYTTMGRPSWEPGFALIALSEHLEVMADGLQRQQGIIEKTVE